MSHFVRALVFVLLSGFVAAQTVDGNLNLGDRFDGNVSSPNDVDVVEFDGLAGELVTITVGPGKKSKLVPSIAIFLQPEGDGEALLQVAAEPTKGKKVAIKNFALQETGRYTLAITGAEGSVGTFRAKTKSKLPKELVKPASAPAPDIDPDAVRVEFSARAGSALNAVVRPGKKSPATPGAPVLKAPSGKQVDLAPFTKQKGTKTTLKKVPLEEFGVYTLEVGNDGPAGEILVATKVLKPKLKKQKLTEYEFGGALLIQPDVLYVGENDDVVVTIALGDANTDTGDVTLVRLEEDGTQTDVTPLFDDGILGQQGDEIEGDNVFSVRIDGNDVDELLDAEGLTSFSVRVGRKGKLGDVLAPAATVLVAEHLSDAEIADVMATQTAHQASIDAAVQNDMLPAVLAQVESDLLADPDVAEVGYSDDGRGLWVLYESGISGLLYTWEDGTKGGGRTLPAGAAKKQPDAVGPSGVEGRLVDGPHYDAYTPSLTKLTGGDALTDAIQLWKQSTLPQVAKGSAATDNLVRSNKVRAIAAQYWDWGEGDDIPAMAQTLIDDKCFEVEYTKYGAEGAGNVEDFKNLSDYGLVLLSSHGDSFYQFLSKPWKAIFGFEGASSQVVVHSNMKATEANVKTYENDLRKGRLVLWYGDYGMTPSFFRTYAGKMPNSIIYTSICRGAYNNTLAKAFLDKGSAAFLSYSDYVAVAFCEANGPALLEKLLMPDMTLDDAFTPGITEVDDDPAEFRLFGDKTVALGANQLHNGGFEDGTAAWDEVGDARAVPSLAGFGPTAGNLMGIISTGLGFTTSSGTFSQTLCLPDDAEYLIFDWIFFSEEFIEYCGSQYQDTFEVRMTDLEGGAGTATLFFTMVDSLCGPVNGQGDFLAKDLIKINASFDQGDVWTTGWRSSAVDVPMTMAGRKVRIDFFSSDVGDSIYDTAIGLDRIEITRFGEN